MEHNTIPLARKPMGPAAGGETDRPIRLLVVEDDPGICQLCAGVLIGSGYYVDTAEDGAAGWEALQASSYDLLITDNSMPRMSGVELVKRLRAARMTLPVVMASATIPTEALNLNSSLQLAATLLKPFTMEKLVGTVEKVLRTAEVTPGHAISFPAQSVALRACRFSGSNEKEMPLWKQKLEKRS